MNLKNFFLSIVSRLVCAIGMTLELISTIFSLWCFFGSNHPNRFLWGLLGIVGLFIGYYIYKFAITYIYDETDHYR
jgi:hypothetical protein